MGCCERQHFSSSHCHCMLRLASRAAQSRHEYGSFTDSLPPLYGHTRSRRKQFPRLSPPPSQLGGSGMRALHHTNHHHPRPVAPPCKERTSLPTHCMHDRPPANPRSLGPHLRCSHPHPAHPSTCKHLLLLALLPVLPAPTVLPPPWQHPCIGRHVVYCSEFSPVRCVLHAWVGKF
jgi:hypothetical protein